MQERSLRLSPIALIGAWTVLMIILTPIVMVVSGTGTAGGEQQPATMLFTMLHATVIGATVLSISTPFFFRHWFNQNRMIALLLIVATTTVTASMMWKRYAAVPYGFKETTESVNGYEFVRKVEYYNMEQNQVRSVSYFRNGQKDSLWTTYDKKGRIVEQIRFRDGKQMSQ